MKKLVAIALALVATTASAASVINSKHDMSKYTGVGGAVGSGDACYFCHAAHNNTTFAPLWARFNPTNGAYTTYTSGTVSVNISGSLDNFSLVCMSCHDGSVALNVTMKGKQGTNAANVYILANNAKIGPDLSNDHPVSVNWVGGGIAGLTASVPAPFRVYNTSRGATALSAALTCGSCHAVHDPGISKFLRANPTSGSFCITCHASK
ncbi:MAG TPA: hypothetical protein VF875_07720 [Anaeromyxobacter sp.]